MPRAFGTRASNSMEKPDGSLMSSRGSSAAEQDSARKASNAASRFIGFSGQMDANAGNRNGKAYADAIIRTPRRHHGE
jgi:hypothetical protein